MRRLNSFFLAAALALPLASPVASAAADALASLPALGVRTAPTLVRDPRFQGLTDNIGLSAAQNERIQQVFIRADDQMKAAFGRHAARAGQMRNEVNAIASLPPGAKRDQAVRAFQARHDAFYSGVLAESKVDFPALARELQGIAPELRFEVQGRSIVATDLRAPATVTRMAPQATPSKAPALAPRTTAPAPTTTPLSGFRDDGQRSCGGVAGGDNRFTGNSVTSSSFAAVAGGCTSEARKVTELAVPAGSSASISLAYNLSAKAFAVGIVGPSWASANAGATVSGYPTDGTNVSVFVLFLWAADKEQTLAGRTRSVEVRPGETIQVWFHTAARSRSAISAGANASATVDGITASLTVTP